MKYKEFVAWCNEQASSGLWSMNTALLCINVMAYIRKKPFWKREREWQKVYVEIEDYVDLFCGKIGE